MQENSADIFASTTLIPHFFPKEEAHYFPLFFSIKKEPNVAKVLAQENPFILELGEYVQLSMAIQTIRELGPCYALSLTTKTIFSQPIAEYITQYFHKRFQFSHDNLMNIQTCLQEAITNAIVHGNLQIENKPSHNLSFMDYYDEVNNRLLDENYSQKRVNIYVWEQPEYFVVCVEDHGKGFNLDAPYDDSLLQHGRGLNIIRAMTHKVWQNEKTSSIYMSFKK